MSTPTEKKKMIGPYEMGKLLGEGAFSKVKLATDTRNGKKVAIKIVNNELVNNVKDMERVCREIHVLKNVKHPNIMQMYEAIDKGSHVYMVLEFAAGGELYDWIIENGPLPPKKAKKMFHQILSAVDHCHRQNLSHRDLKPENVMLDEQFNAKVADFGLSNDMNPGEMLKTICGSPAYSAPEIIKGVKYDGCAVDVWSCGVILYFIVCGHLPFEADNQARLFDLILAANYTIPDRVGAECADLIRQFLTVDPNRRATITQAWAHPWLQSLHSGSMLMQDGEDDSDMAFSDDHGEDFAGMPALSIDDPAKGMPALADCWELSPKSWLPTNAGDMEYLAHFARVSIKAIPLGTSSDSSKRKRAVPSTQDVPVVDVGEAFITSCLVREAGYKTTEATAGTNSSPASPKMSARGASTRSHALINSSSSSPRSPLGLSRGQSSAREVDPARLPTSHSATITSKDPKTIVRELQRQFAEHKMLLRASGATSVKGDRNKTRFEIQIARVVEVDGSPVDSAQQLYFVMSQKLSGDASDYRIACRKLLWKM